MARIHLTTLEEDMRAIGLLPKAEAKQPVAEAKKVEESVKAEGLDEAEALAEAIKAVRKRRKRTTSAQRAKWRKAAKTRKAYFKKYRKLATTKRRMKKIAAFKKRKGIEAGDKVRVQMAGVDRLSNLIDDVNGIVESIESASHDQLLKGFANLAIVSDLLSRNFARASAEMSEEALSEMSELYNQVAEDAAALAEALHGGEEYDRDEIEESFRDDMECLIDGLEMYDDIFEAKKCGAMAEMDGEEECDCGEPGCPVCGDEEDMMDGEEEMDDEEEMEEAKKGKKRSMR